MRYWSATLSGNDEALGCVLGDWLVERSRGSGWEERVASARGPVARGEPDTPTDEGVAEEGTGAGCKVPYDHGAGGRHGGGACTPTRKS